MSDLELLTSLTQSYGGLGILEGREWYETCSDEGWHSLNQLPGKIEGNNTFSLFSEPVSLRSIPGRTGYGLGWTDSLKESLSNTQHESDLLHITLM